MRSRHNTVSFLSVNELFLLAVVYDKVSTENMPTLMEHIKAETGVDFGRQDLFNITNDDILKLKEFEERNRKYLSALINDTVVEDDNNRETIRVLNFKIILITIGVIFALIWITLLIFVSVPPENTKFIDAGIGMITSLVGCFAYGYLRNDTRDKK